MHGRDNEGTDVFAFSLLVLIFSCVNQRVDGGLRDVADGAGGVALSWQSVTKVYTAHPFVWKPRPINACFQMLT